MNIKLAAIDLDGTLLTDQYEMTPRTKEAVQNMQKQGVKIILASGRGPKSCDPYHEQLQLADVCITHNGAVIYDRMSGKTWLEVGFEANELRPLIEYCRKLHLHFDLSTAFDMYIERENRRARDIYRQFFVDPIRVADAGQLPKKIVKFTIFDPDETRLDRVMDELVPMFPNWSIVRSGETFIDVIHPRATKGRALRHLLQAYRIQADEVVAFGNFYNDLEMIQLAGLGVAMANAPEEVKEQADRITASNNEDGVALILEELIHLPGRLHIG